jgi:predicted transcriptional regulator
MQIIKHNQKTVSIENDKGAFSFFKKHSEERIDFKELSELRSILSNEKARILYLIKHEKPESIYKLSKICGRSFRAVLRDVRLLEKFGFIKIVKEKYKSKQKHRPILAAENIVLNFKI